MTIQQQMEQAAKAWVASSGGEKEEQAVLRLLEDPAHKSLPYIERNREFLTSSKLRAFRECPFHCKLKYVDRMNMGFDEQDYFTVGSAFDLRLTSGEEAYQSKYAAVKIRNDKAVTENPGKVLLTNAQAQVIDNATKEYLSRDLFPKQPLKQNIIFLLSGIPCKIELDHFDEAARMIEDTKTTASISTFDPHFYDLQATFYALGVEKRLGLACEVALNVVDKKTDFSRSHRWVFSRATLQAKYYEVEKLVLDWRDAVDTGIWSHVDPNTEEGLRVCWASEYWSACPYCRTASPTIL